MYTLYQVYLEKTHMEVDIFAPNVVDMKYKFTSFCMDNVCIYDQVLVTICKIIVEGGFGSNIWGSILFSGWKYSIIFYTKPWPVGHFTADLFLLQPCYVTTGFFCCSHGNKDFWAAKQDTGLREYKYSLLRKKFWSLEADQTLCCSPSGSSS